MNQSYLIGIDIGTSACKVALFDRSGCVLAAANGDYPVYYPKEGWAEQNPEEWWSAVCGAVRQVIEEASVAPEEIAGVGIDGQSWSAIAIDRNGHVLTNTPIWMEERSLSATVSTRKSVQRQSLRWQETPFSHLMLQRRFSGIKKTFRRCMPKLTKSFSPTALLLLSLQER